MGFFEILVIAAITLFVVGPERMPEAVRSVALTVGRIKRSFRSAKQEIEKQIGADDIRRQLHNEEVMQNLKATRDEMESMLNHEHQQSARAEQESHSQRHDEYDEHSDEHEHNIVHPDQHISEIAKPVEVADKPHNNKRSTTTTVPEKAAPDNQHDE